MIRVTDTEAEPDLVKQNLNPLQTSRLVAPQQQSQALQQQHHHYQPQQQQHLQQQHHKEAEQEVHPQFDPKVKLQKANSNSHCQPAEDAQQGHQGEAPGHQSQSHHDLLGHLQGHPDTATSQNVSHNQDAAATQSQSHRNALGHDPDGVSGRWAKKKAPKMPPLQLGGGRNIHMMIIVIIQRMMIMMMTTKTLMMMMMMMMMTVF